MKIVSKELVALAIENELQEHNVGMILLPEKGIKIKAFTPIDLIHITIWFQSSEGKVVAADYNIDRDYYKLRLSKEEIVHILTRDKLTLDELRMYYNTLSSVDKFFLIDEFAKEVKQEKNDYIEKLIVKRLVKSVYMERKGIVKST